MLRHRYRLISDHFPQMVVIRQSHIRIVCAVYITVIVRDRFHIRAAVLVSVFIAECSQVRVQINIHLVCAIRVDLVRVRLLNRHIFLHDRKFRRKIIFDISAVELYVKRHLLRKHMILIKIEHHRDRAPQKRHDKQRRQRPHRKPHRLDLRGELPEQKQILPPVDCPSLTAHITDHPGGKSRIKQIDHQDQTDQKCHDNDRIPFLPAKQPHTEKKQKYDGQRKDPPLYFLTGFFDRLILPFRIYQAVDIHFSEFPLTAQKCQQITARIAERRHDDALPVDPDADPKLHQDHAVEHRHQDLLHQHSKHKSREKSRRAKKHIFAHIQLCDLPFLHAQEQIDPKLPAALFHDEPQHIIDQPRDDDHDEKCRQPQHDRQDPHLIDHLLYVLRKQKAVKGKH